MILDQIKLFKVHNKFWFFPESVKDNSKWQKLQHMEQVLGPMPFHGIQLNLISL